jgi:hypothetical protein
VGTFGGPLLGLDPLHGRAGSLVVGPLGGVVGLGAEGPIWVGDLVAAPVVLDLGGGLAPSPPTPSRFGNWPEGRQDIAGTLLFDG